MTVDEDSDILGRETLSVGKWLLAIRRGLLSPFIGREAKEVFILIETVRSSETPVNFNQTTWHDIPDGGSFYIYLYLSFTVYKYLCSIVCLM